MANVKIESSWKTLLADEFNKPYFETLVKDLKAELQAGKKIYPEGKDIFKAFDLSPVDKTKVVLIGQDPYHNPGQATGLCFSVPPTEKVPASLRNIYKELKTDIGKEIPTHGDLSHWAEQGVLMLNAILTVEHNSPGSHRKLGWQQFTDNVITTLSETTSGLVFLLWGNYAKSKQTLIDDTKHHLLMAAHPSPLARFGFIGCQHFSKCNTILTEQNKTPIKW